MMPNANPLAPINYSLMPGSNGPIGYDYVYNVQLIANQALNDQIQTDNDFPFAWRAIVVNLLSGAFSVQFSIGNWYNLSSGQIHSSNLQSDPSNAYPIVPELLVPAGAKIGVNITDLSAAGNTIQIILRGVKLR